jgi:bifunctional DNA-binding transcriptional regulator/antitoxin component of YhaV-PrlF toxin-antitoxin module
MLTAATSPVELDQRQRLDVSRLDHIYGEVHRSGTLATGAANLRLRPTCQYPWHPVGVRVTLDSAGRLAVPKALRDVLGFVDGVELELTAVDGRLEIAIPSRIVVEQGPYGVRFAADTSAHMTIEQVRDIMERGRR